MWKPDAYGYLQYQRAINGFLRSLFGRWRDEKCSHEVNLIFFARHLYRKEDLKSPDQVLDNFPFAWQNHVQEMDENYVYIDYYRSICIEGAPAIRADRAESILSKCREIIINWKENSGIYFPDGRCAPLLREESTNNETRFELSSAAEGNFLEAINMSLHVFEQHQKGYG